MSMFRYRRSLRADFVQHFQTLGAWPTRDALQTGLRSVAAHGTRNEDYSKLRRGEAVAPRLVNAFVLYCRERRGVRHSPAGQALESYLSARDIDPAGDVKIPQIVDVVSIPVAGTVKDAYLNGLRVFLELFYQIRHPERWARPCADEIEVKRAVHWMFIEVGRMISAQKLPFSEAVRIGESYVGVSLKDYQERAVAWWQRVPWSVVLGLNSAEKIVGMSIALPLKENAYATVRAGERLTYDCRPDDLQFPSANLLIEGFTMRPRRDPNVQPPATMPVLVASLCQQAYLTRVPNVGFGVPIRLLAFAATATNHKRAAQFGFTETGTQMHGRDIKMLERVVNPAEKPGDCAIFGPWYTLQSLLARTWK